MGNLSFDVTKQDLVDAFGAIGPVVDVVIPLDRATGRMRGFAFVEYEKGEDASRAITELNGKDLAGRPLRVNEAQARQPRRFSGPPSGGGGGFGDFAPSFDPRDRPFKSKGSRRNIRRRKRGF